MAVQVKRWKANVQAPIVQQVRGSLGTHDQGLIITTSDFSPGAREEAERANAVPVALMNGSQLVALLVEHEIGVHRVPHYLIELAPETVGGVADEASAEVVVSLAGQTTTPLELTTGRQIRRSTTRLTTKVEANQLVVRFADGPTRTWDLSTKEDKASIRTIRFEAIRFAHDHGATPGQENAVRKALTSAGYHLTR